MEELLFKKIFRDGLFTYISIGTETYYSLSSFETGWLSYPNVKAIDSKVIQNTFYQYLALAQYCCEYLDKFCITSTNLVGVDMDPAGYLGQSLWKYELLADDFNGLGIDKGFVQTRFNANDPLPHAVIQLESFMDLTNFPSDIFGEVRNCCTLLGLKASGKSQLLDFLNSKEAPSIHQFLRPGELLIHAVVGKQVGYYNALLIRSALDLDERFEAFFNILNPDN